MIGPAVDQLSEEFHVSLSVATYQFAAFLIAVVLGSLVWIPVANAYGHRLVFLLCPALDVTFTIAAAKSNSFGMLLALRGLIGATVANIILGIAVVSNLFFVHQRGRAMGFYVVVAFNGAHAGPIVIFRVSGSLTTD